jgi:hypothetical protein
MDERLQLEIEAAAFRRLRAHLLEDRADVQNIDLMNLAGFCRNCLSRWMQEAAAERGVAMTKEEGRELFYGMSYGDWAARHQTEASAEQKAAFETAFAANVGAREPGQES